MGTRHKERDQWLTNGLDAVERYETHQTFTRRGLSMTEDPDQSPPQGTVRRVCYPPKIFHCDFHPKLCFQATLVHSK